MTATNPASTAPSLSVDDILSDLAALSSPSPQGTERNTSTSSATPSASRHPILSLGRSLAPADSLSSSERGGGDHAHGLDELATQQLLNGDHAATNQTAAQQLRLLEQYLVSAKTISSLNQGAQAGEDITAPGVDNLHERIAQLQVRLDALERGVQDALNVVGQDATS